MGFRGVPSADMFFDEVRVPAANVVVSPPEGFRKLMEAFDLERCGNATSNSRHSQNRSTRARRQFLAGPIDDHRRLTHGSRSVQIRLCSIYR